MNYVTTIVTLFVIATTGLSQPAIDQLRFYDIDHRSDQFWDVYHCDNGDFLVCGQSAANGGYENLVMRLDPRGHPLWTYLCPGSYFNSIIEADDGDAVITGSTHSFAVSRLSREGDLVWKRSYGSGIGGAIIELKAGDFVVAGLNYLNGNWTHNGRALRLNGDGDVIWDHTYGSFEDTCSISEMRETEGGVVMGGYLIHNELNNGWIQKTDFDGQVIWSNFYGDQGATVSFVDMTSLPDGGFAFAGSAGAFSLWKINGNGDLTFQHQIQIGQDVFGRNCGINKLSDGGFILVGYIWHGHELREYPFAIRTDINGTVQWTKDFADQIEPTNNYLRSVIVLPNDVIVAAGGMSNPDNDGSLDGVLVRLDPDIPDPILFYRSPEDSFLTVLQDDSIQFKVLARARQGDEFNYRWLRNGESIGGGVNDTIITVPFPEVGVDTVECRVTIDDYTTETGWIVTVRDLFIASHTPDTLNLAVRRGSTVTCTIDSVAATQGDPVNYAWTLRDLANGQQEDEGVDSSATVEFRRSGDYTLESYVYRGESSDAVTWNIAVRSLVFDFRPEQQTLTVPLDTTMTFGIIPFDPADTTLRYLWLVDGDSLGADSSDSVRFTEVTGGQGRLPYAVMAIVSDSADADTIVWKVTVVRQEDVRANWNSPLRGLGISLSPNPFNARTTVRFSVPEAGLARVKVYDLTGKTVATLFEGRVGGGQNVRPTATFDAANLPAGLYLVRLEAGGRIVVKKAVVLK